MNIENQSKPSRDGSRFLDTRWSLVCSLKAPDEPVRRSALEEFCQLYWYPLYLFARRKGCSPEDAEDLTQLLFHKLLSGEGLNSLNQGKGRIRSYLLQSMRNLIASEWKKSVAQRRGSGAVHLSFDAENGEARYAAEPTTSITPESEFDRRCACALMQQAADRLEEEFTKGGRSHVFTALRESLGGEGSKTYPQLAAELGMTISAIKVTVHRMRARYRNLLLEEIRESISTPEEIDDEVAHLRQVFA